MSIVTIRNVEFINNPARFLDEYQFRVTFECIAPLDDDLEWRLIYVSSPDNEDLDQELDDCLVGPVPSGVNSFVFSGSPPDPSKIPPEDVLGVAALILTASYKDQEFVRVGYYQNTEYDNEEMKENPPKSIVFDRLVRDISEKPRVTRFQIKCGEPFGRGVLQMRSQIPYALDSRIFLSRDIIPPHLGHVSAGAATSAAVPSANDLDDTPDVKEDPDKPNGTPTS
ncbi:hypothetical protein ONZ45_g3747 [Pleurotus djamor]|nr:hypothetical protein ONZ45_g3747 [Pleurotus djamor]